MDEKHIEEIVGKAVGEAMVPLIKQVGETVHRIEQRFEDHTNRNLEHYQNTSKRLDGFNGNLRRLWKKVNGADSDPPDPSELNGGGDVDSPGLDEIAERAHDMASEHDLDIPAIESKVLVVDGKVETIKGEVKDVNDKVDGLIELQKKQMSAQGMRPDDDERSFGRRFFDLFTWFVKEKEGQKFALAAFAAITSLVTALGTTYALMTGRLPLPNQHREVPALHAPPQDNQGQGQRPSPAP